jgi:hypothetical protein
MKISNCPICGLPWSEPVDEEEVRYSYWICECCGCEYGNDDNSAYRENWLKQGAPWFDPKQRPNSWNLEEQLRHIIPDWNAR